MDARHIHKILWKHFAGSRQSFEAASARMVDDGQCCGDRSAAHMTFLWDSGTEDFGQVFLWVRGQALQMYRRFN